MAAKAFEQLSEQLGGAAVVSESWAARPWRPRALRSIRNSSLLWKTSEIRVFSQVGDLPRVAIILFAEEMKTSLASITFALRNLYPFSHVLVSNNDLC